MRRCLLTKGGQVELQSSCTNTKLALVARSSKKHSRPREQCGNSLQAQFSHSSVPASLPGERLCFPRGSSTCNPPRYALCTSPAFSPQNTPLSPTHRTTAVHTAGKAEQPPPEAMQAGTQKTAQVKSNLLLYIKKKID